MNVEFKDLSGRIGSMDLRLAVELVAGRGKKTNWTAMIVFLPNDKKFIELRDHPQDVRGNSTFETEEVTERYVIENYDISQSDLDRFKRKPNAWTFIDRR